MKMLKNEKMAAPGKPNRIVNKNSGVFLAGEAYPISVGRLKRERKTDQSRACV